ncbi:ATP-binding cassette domain-containing protein [uncultured Microbacterium sp.]|uniref:ABC transporter ATP-binding protein n=1 Tax=uncultured Microbacterium sp. TaxID=191216 RepID=UPI002639233F|nr:ATP-binding cassette domain-containing protein [uncultured Microbacterium sp.]
MTGVGLDAAVQVQRAPFTLDARLQAAPGEIVAVMGPSGAGKSTLLGAVAGFVPLTAGSVALDGRVVQDAAGEDVPPRERGVILLGQQARLFPHLSARENVAFGLRARRVSRRAARASADAWLERVGLPDLGDRRPARLSGGQQQRVALARALATSPRVLLLDEPLTSLDPATADGIRSLLREELAETGTTAVLATHDATDAVALADRLVVLEAGRITADGAPDDVLARSATPFIAAVAGTRAGWQAVVESVETDAAGILARVRTSDGALLELPFPADAPLVPGSIISIRPPSA